MLSSFFVTGQSVEKQSWIFYIFNSNKHLQNIFENLFFLSLGGLLPFEPHCHFLTPGFTEPI